MTLSYDKILRRAALCMLMLLMTGACSRRGPVLTFREADDPTADTLADWSGVASGLHAAWARPTNVTPAPSCPAPRSPNAA